jgi:outer membrane immunogenic protein
MLRRLRLSAHVSACFGALLICGGPAIADGSLKDTYVAPVPTWTGCYAGVDDGYKWGRTRLTTPTPYTLNNPTRLVATTDTEHLHTNGFLLGGQFGCNYQVARGLVVGLEISGTRDWGKDTTSAIVTTTARAAAVAVPIGTLTTESVRTCQFRVGPRIGTTLGGAGLAPLVYATGGYAGACNRTTQVGQFDDPFVTNTNVSTHRFDSGWFLGAGTDIPTPFLMRNSFVQIEFTHADYGSSSAALAGTATTGKLDNTTNELRFGFKYRFQ